ncbi:MAG: hypothetical protein RLZZ165_736, partial [Bacteroidota bacterium]
MRNKFTEDDILRFLYSEMTPQEQDAFLHALAGDEALQERFEALNATQEGLRPVELAPAEASVKRIMGHARRAANKPCPRLRRLAYAGGGSRFAFQQMILFIMVAFTCI